MQFIPSDAKHPNGRNANWASFRYHRYRRPVIIALCCVVLLIYWARSAPVSNRSTEHGVLLANVDKATGRNRRVGHEELHRKYKEQIAQEQAAARVGLAGDTRPVLIPDDSAQERQPLDDEDVDLPLRQEDTDAAKKEPKLVQDDDDPSRVERLQKGPVNVQADLDPKNEKLPLLSSPDSPQKKKVIEAESNAHLILEEKGDSLPEIIHIPFEDVVGDLKLVGWEDEWIADASFDPKEWGTLEEPKVDFIYLWVNGSEEAFQSTKRPYEENSVLNDPEGTWLASHGTNRYRDWDELKYSVRSVEKYAAKFRNKIQILVNDVAGTAAGKQVPSWLKNDEKTATILQVLSQKEVFDKDKHVCLPTFNSLTMENQLFNTPSETDYVYALSDDMLLGKEHAASDVHSPLFGPVMGFKQNAYNTVNPPGEADAARFGEKPYLIYTSWLLNRRFGNRKRRGQGHFGHALSRSIMREAIGSFPGPELQSACKRFRGEPGFQLYSWYATFHYLIERHREAMLWSYIIHRADVNQDGFLSWNERQQIMSELERGMEHEGSASWRRRNFYHINQLLEKAGLESPKVNNDHVWTSLDGPWSIINADCSEFDVNECLAPGFSISSTDARSRNPVFSSAVIFDRLARQMPTCGDCLLKLLLQQVPRGLSPILPDAASQPEAREVVVKALMKYRYTISNPDALFVMVTDADQVDSTLTNKYVRQKKQLAGQLCLNDDVATEDEEELLDVKKAMTELFQGLFPQKSRYER